MRPVDLIFVTTAVFAMFVAGLMAHRLYRWERALRRARVVVYFKGKQSMAPRLIDWLNWILALERDKAAKGQTIYKMGGTTIQLQRTLAANAYQQTTRTTKGAGK